MTKRILVPTLTQIDSVQLFSVLSTSPVGLGRAYVLSRGAARVQHGVLNLNQGDSSGIGGLAVHLPSPAAFHSLIEGGALFANRSRTFHVRF